MMFQSNMLWTGLLAATALPAASAFPSFLSTRGYAATNANLYAYGANISGLPILYSVSDSLLYIAQSNTTASGIVSVTWDIPSMSSASTTSATATLSNGTSPGVLYTGVNDTALSNVAVVDSASVDGTTTGYTLYGKQLVYYDGSALEAKFWAKQVVDGADSVWQLLWNNQNQDQTLLTPVAIKITAPATATTSSSS